LKRNPEVPWGRALPHHRSAGHRPQSYEAIIRINSQSGKGGVAYVLDREHGFDLPKTMHPQVGKRIYDLADELGRELTADEIRDAFFREFVNVSSPLDVIDYELVHQISERGR
jgi:2-isopropylmalate synthase